MARGWESKSVEAQIEEAGSRKAQAAGFTAEERALRHKLDGLDLSRKRVLHDLDSATSPLRRAALERALAFLDEEIAKLGGKDRDVRH